MTPVRLGVVLLCHDDLGLAARLARVRADGGARVAVHAAAKVRGPRLGRLRDALKDCEQIVFSPRHRCSWGRFSLVRATQDAATALRDRFPDTTHVFLASGACLPLRPVADLVAYLGADPDRDHIESVNRHDVGWTVGGLNAERFSLFFPFDWKRRRRLFDHTGRPYALYDDHIGMLAESRCFVARKIWPGAMRLLAHFPLPDTGRPQVDPSQPGRISRIINQTVRRRVLGRPGLYMQSRFPRKDAENGKTSAPCAVILGVSDIFPGSEDWLRGRVVCDVHGRLLGPEGAEFAGRPLIGPGAISADARVRDSDPQGFLTSLIRITGRMQLFQFSLHDNQALNWFMATDPNAHLLVVTGAWTLPLPHSGMPFDDVRRMFAHLQRTELDHLEVLNSVWVRARLQQYDLGEFLPNPRPLLEDFIQRIDPDAGPLPGLPVMRDLTGLDAMLRRLRNSGLRPRLTAEDLPAVDLLTGERAAAE